MQNSRTGPGATGLPRWRPPEFPPVTGGPRSVSLHAVVTDSFGFGGQNTVLVLTTL
jgi:3-oxoacyl-(acyl-carrier-protein) synthase